MPVCLIRPDPDRRGYYRLHLNWQVESRVAASEGEAIVCARHAVSRNGGRVWLVDATGYPVFAETVEAKGDTGLRGGLSDRNGQL